MENDFEIVKKSDIWPIEKIAEIAGIKSEYLELYGKYKAKIDLSILKNADNNPNGHLILITAMNPTPYGEGKTLTTIGLGQALSLFEKKAIITLREPSMGPVFGVKGGATGGGRSQILPMEDINLHFTGDIHAIQAAHNLLAAMLDTHILMGNELDIDINNVVWPRAIDMNDRALRNIVIGLGGSGDGIPRESKFIITAASEIMSIVCLSKDIFDLKSKLANITVAFDRKGNIIKAGDLKIEGALAAILKDALKPNLVQTIEHTPAIVHGGPFANISIGTNSIIATNIALKLADFVVIEAGFGADLGAEKFFNIVSRNGNFSPSVVVLVVTCKAIKYHGGLKDIITYHDEEAFRKGLKNVEKHIDNLKLFGVPIVVSINKFDFDRDQEIEMIKNLCSKKKVPVALSTMFSEGGKGGLELANIVLELSKQENTFKPLYELSDDIEKKIDIIAKKIYGAKRVIFETKPRKKIELYKKLGYGNLPICIAKTQMSLSDEKNLIGVPPPFDLEITDVELASGAGYIVILCGNINLMPGLSSSPAALNMDIDHKGNIQGLL
ncbi:MAG: Formate--tetrahydrofolate ligase [Candidatus Methanofastidiosum methylothiophilum]|uniref:Formate--tetrahydrofolate ligase n=1 Tax=Candidatus Methanofastidiosum methylothiophilum TaxID=1705564 RepID=A0A150JE35_9EURY|nr:MAG: Formate--tetrahydrofolate ligase [Candidatus Methanofastidiosum methylthiophilus]HOE93055.1 formate--tetrahydrofolate ligase [Methanofastidiosum sp.]KYC57405.1 MAG: Formate--tetrahydrofolate ligase [Candidatus Methanofastidiosum methylthiophilus]KYC58191.1 MAG: Formate--tetrahydrofolate ligase [Candidatus Methanofastidiosum methylthiophilus]HOR87279.1 formate--tetrahydrofolate ligase [Methanofastidiosum sp.]